MSPVPGPAAIAALAFSVAAPPPVSARSDLDLRDALALAVRQHPALAADSAEVRAREAEVAQAARRPNPELSFELENFAGTGPFGGVRAGDATLAFTQVVELGGKRAARRAASRGERDVAARDLEARRADVVTETAIAFAEVVAAQERLALADTLLTVADDVLASVSRRVRAGGISPVEERRARVARESDRIERDRAARELGVARARLAATWGDPDAAFGRALGGDEIVTMPGPAALDDRLAESPELRRRIAELERRRVLRDLARADGVPDLTVSGGVRRLGEGEDTALVLAASVPLPLFDRNRDATAAAERRVAGAEAERQAAEIRVRSELLALHAELETTAAEATALRDRILPEAAAAFAEAAAAYEQGRFRLTDVLDTKRTYFELRGRTVDAVARHRVAVARIERLLGAPLATPSREDD